MVFRPVICIHLCMYMYIHIIVFLAEIQMSAVVKSRMHVKVNEDVNWIICPTRIMCIHTLLYLLE